MATNIFGNPGGRANVAIAKVSEDLGEMGFNDGNVLVIYEINNQSNNTKSWRPERDLNSFNSTTAGRGYYIIALQDLDLTEYFFPPVPSAPTSEFDDDEYG
jgi:hypothetical protein